MPDPLLVVACHDAGGAEIVSSWLRRFSFGLRGRVRFFLDGPAVQIFERKVGFIPMDQGDATRARLVLCGSSGQSDLERDVVDWAMDLGLRTAVWLDHWTNYAARFRRAPSELWVTDEYARDLARRIPWAEPPPRIYVRGNPYLADVVADVQSRSGHVERVLCVLGPSRLGQDEIHLDPQRWPSWGHVLRLRPHPEDRLAGSPLAEDVAWADTVVGYDSMAMVVALKAGRRVYSVLPRDQRLTIPYPGIERL